MAAQKRIGFPHISRDIHIERGHLSACVKEVNISSLSERVRERAPSSGPGINVVILNHSAALQTLSTGFGHR